MMVAAVSTEPTLRVSRSEVLFEGQYVSSPGGGLDYDVSADGRRFVMMLAEDQDDGPERASTHTKLILVENWFEELKRLVPTD